MIWYCGITSSCVGTSSTERNSAKTRLRPRNFSQANANAAIEQNSSCAAVRARALTTLLTSSLPNGTASSAFV